MSDRADSHALDSPDDERPLTLDGPVSVESYETEGRTVFFDAHNPLAWMETSRTLRLRECL